MYKAITVYSLHDRSPGGPSVTLFALAYNSYNTVCLRCFRPLEVLQVTVRSFRDPHEVLGVSHDADDEEVKKAYKKLALRLHPDVNKEELAEAKFRALRDAYELLMGKGDPAREKNAPFGGNWEFHDWCALLRCCACTFMSDGCRVVVAFYVQVLVVQHATAPT